MTGYKTEKLIDGAPTPFQISASFSINEEDLFQSFPDVGVVEYCNALPSGSKWPRMSKGKRAYIHLKSVEEGYRGAEEIKANVEKAIWILRDKTSNKIKRRKRGNRRDYHLTCIGAKRGPTSPRLVYTESQFIKAFRE